MWDNIAIIGANGAIGNAFIEVLSAEYPAAQINGFSRQPPSSSPTRHVVYHAIDYADEVSIEKAAQIAAADNPLDLVIVATGILHDGDMMPEKALRDLSAEKFHHLFMANTITPALIAKYFLPKIHKEKTAIFAALSARVGSISDNHIGGWYAYRASKAALNMIIKNAAIEMQRRYKNSIVIGLHPGTVDSALSKPFQSNVPDKKLFSPEFAAQHLITVINQRVPEDSGKCYDWDGQIVEP